MQKLLYGPQEVRVTKFPFSLQNGMRLLRFERPSSRYPSGMLLLNDGRQNYVAAPAVYGFKVHVEA